MKAVQGLDGSIVGVSAAYATETEMSRPALSVPNVPALAKGAFVKIAHHVREVWSFSLAGPDVHR